jgi:acetylornithine deacetylase/succinyl-diaminopimelate desuccinylase-like protein
MSIRRKVGGVFALSALVSACSSPGGLTGPSTAARVPAAAASPAPSGCPRAAALDKAAVATEAACWLAEYIQIDTTNPPGNEVAAARYLAQLLEREGIPAELVEPSPGRANLIARLPGKVPGGALMLMHHMDVVPASADEWSVAPFSGAIHGGNVWGRGSIDNKGGGVAELLALVMFKRLGLVPERELVLVALADEESGSRWGSRWLVEQRKELFEDVEFVLNEGGGVLTLPSGQVLYSVEIAQKAPLWLRVTARGKSGHGGAPSPGAATTVLIRALARLEAHTFPIEVSPEVAAVFAARAAGKPEADRARYANLKASLAEPQFRERFLKDPHDAALVRNTVAVTMLSGSPKENVISERATAVLDVRLLPGQDPAVVTRELGSVLGEPGLELEPLLSWQAHRSPRDTPLFLAIERLARQRHPGAPVASNVIGGFTDCNAVRALGKTCYGFLPLQIAMADIGSIHGKNEHISIDALGQAVLDLHALVRELGSPGPK